LGENVKAGVAGTTLNDMVILAVAVQPLPLTCTV